MTIVQNEQVRSYEDAPQVREPPGCRSLPIAAARPRGWSSVLSQLEGSEQNRWFPGCSEHPRGLEPASLLKPQDYPVLATCQACGRTVRCQGYLLGDWAHVVPQQSAPAGS